jgi:putative acetyltransferase
MAEFVFRAATNKDTTRITELIKSVLAEFGLEYSPDTTDMDLTDIEKNYTGNGGKFEIIEDDKKEIIGTAALYRVDESTCMLRKMYLDKKFRNLGLGRQLLERILGTASGQGFKEMILETNTRMIAAISLYEKYGFKKIENLNDTAPRCNLTMKKLLHS